MLLKQQIIGYFQIFNLIRNNIKINSDDDIQLKTVPTGLRHTVEITMI